MIDIGVNLTNSQFRHDRDQVLQDAWAHGVTGMVITGTTRAHSVHALELARAHPGKLYSTAGVHPHHASEYDSATHTWLQAFSQQPEVRAIGECGLDYNRNFSPPDTQRSCFAAQLEIAVATGKPVFLHQRDAHKDFSEILQHQRAHLSACVAHCFTGTEHELREYLDMDLYIGITGWICDERRGVHLRKLVKLIPLNRIMIETDAPYLLPRDLQPRPVSKRNEPKYLAHINATIARCLDLDPAALAQQTQQNTVEFFQLSEI